jgi:hypothetical protein
MDDDKDGGAEVMRGGGENSGDCVDAAGRGSNDDNIAMGHENLGKDRRMRTKANGSEEKGRKDGAIIA